MRGAHGQEAKQHKLLAALRDAKGSWKTEDHPELKDGPEAFIEKLRAENEKRLPIRNNR